MDEVETVEDKVSEAKDSKMAFFCATLPPYFLLGSVADL